MHGRAHTELGKLADMTGDRAVARKEYQLAAQRARSADDSIGLADAQRLIAEPYRETQAGAVSRRSESAQEVR